MFYLRISNIFQNTVSQIATKESKFNMKFKSLNMFYQCIYIQNAKQFLYLALECVPCLSFFLIKGSIQHLVYRLCTTGKVQCSQEFHISFLNLQLWQFVHRGVKFEVCRKQIWGPRIDQSVRLFDCNISNTSNISNL